MKKSAERVKAVSLPPHVWARIDTLAEEARHTARVPRLRGWRSYVMRKVVEYGMPAVEADLKNGCL